VKVKLGPTRTPTIVKACICVFVSTTVKAVHIEAVTDLTTDAFLACLTRFIARRAKPKLIMSDHSTNFVGAARELKNLTAILQEKKHCETITKFCS
jgi:hypothetical protein